ncbi:hypothetical protein [Azospirillum sp.]|uniref:hypothetical protein n=1 Tax=Azospirillum sp. TaxID=34012 RepID=UPI002D71ED50|nr:hypothetical protein [Azospirillum sp.]HYD66552.1 hypothetical protein [Azospirillum sp.]
MSQVTQVSSYASHLSLVRNMTRNQEKLDLYQTQIATQKKSIDLQAYGSQTKEVLDLRTELVQRESYVRNIDMVTPRLKGYDKVLTRLSDIAAELTGNTVFPRGPGPAKVSTVTDVNSSKMKVTVNTDGSTFKQAGKYTVTAVPSTEGRPNTMDITVTDGLGGTSVRSVELPPVPPGDGYRFNFKMGGGPGDGTTLNLTFDRLVSGSSSSFDVTFPEIDSTRQKVEGTFQEIRQLLNERIGDRYLFAGARSATEPVGNPAPTRQISVVTLNGAVGEAGETYSVELNGRRFSYTTQGVDGAAPEPNMSFIAKQLSAQINAAIPAMNVTASVVGKSNTITLIANAPGENFTASADVVERPETYNSVSHLFTTQEATSTQPQISTMKFNGPTVDIGDRFGVKVTYSRPGLFDHAVYEVAYQVNEANVHDLPGMSRMDMVTTRLAEQINKTIPELPFAAQVTGVPGDLRLEVVGRKDGKPFELAVNDGLNGNIRNTMTVATLPPGTVAPVSDVTVEEPLLPDYDAEFNPLYPNRPRPEAWEKAAITLDQGITVTYGITATEPTFQTLIRAFRYARAAVDNPGQYTDHMAKAKELLTDAKMALRSMNAKAAVDMTSLEASRKTHEGVSNDLVERTAQIEGIDYNTVAMQLKQTMSTMEASYTVAGRAARLSLINYIA